MRPILRQRLALIARAQSRTITKTPRILAKDQPGRGPEEHVTNQDHNYNIHEEASNRGQQAKKEDMNDNSSAGKSSTATSESSTSTARQEEAKSGKKDRGMGLQDERGGKGR